MIRYKALPCIFFSLGESVGIYYLHIGEHYKRYVGRLMAFADPYHTNPSQATDRVVSG